MMTLGRRFGRPVLTVGDNGAAAGLRGTLPFDDEGTPTQDTVLIKGGVLVGRLHSRETAAHMGERPTGNARADLVPPPADRAHDQHVHREWQGYVRRPDSATSSWACTPAARSAARRCSRTSPSQRRTGRMIRDGKPAELVKDVVLAGNLFQTLDRIERIAGDFRWNQMGGGCGKAASSRCRSPKARRTCGSRRRWWAATWRRDLGLDRPGAPPRLRADALRRRADTTSISFESGRLKAAAVSEQAGINLRV